MACTDSFYIMEPRRSECSDIYGIPESACLTDIEEVLLRKFDLLACDRAVMPLGYKKGFGDFESTIWRKRTEDV
jgi:hypothetical protein